MLGEMNLDGLWVGRGVFEFAMVGVVSETFNLLTEVSRF